MKTSLPRRIPRAFPPERRLVPRIPWFRRPLRYLPQVLLAVVALIPAFSPGATIQGGSLLLTSANAQQLEGWIGGGPLAFTRVFTSIAGDGKTASTFHQAVDGLGRTVVVVEIPAQNGYARKIIGGYNPQAWDSSGAYHFTTNDAQRTGFLFNLTSNGIFRQKLSDIDGGIVGSYQTFNGPNSGPSFGGGPDIEVAFGLHNGSTYGSAYGPSGFGTSILGGGQGDGGSPLSYGTVEVFAINLPASVPQAITLDADGVTTTSATLNATVSSNLLTTDAVFRYSTDPTFATGTVTTSTQNLPGSAVGTLVTRTISGLTPGTTYYFRLVATNALGTTTGATLAFLTTDSSIGYRFAPIPNSNTGTFGGATFGSSFTTNAACAVTHLGVYDHNQNGLNGNMQVGLWNASGVLLASTTVLRNDSLYRNCRYHPLATPFPLAANTRYYIGAYYAVSDVYGYTPLSFASDSRITFSGYAYRTGSFSFPNEAQGTPTGQVGYFGANLLLEADLKAPLANAGPDQTVDEDSSVQLDGSGSVDTNLPARALSYLWTQVSGPIVSLASPTSSAPSFTAPTAPAGGLALVFKLVVSNGTLTATDFVTVNVANVNHPPTAKAGPDQTVGESSTVTLDASGSSDPDGDPLTVLWSQVSGPAVQLDDASISNPQFKAPAVSAAEASMDLTFQLVVNDGNITSGASTVTVHVKNTNDAPTADAGDSFTVRELDDVSLDGTRSTDPDNDSLTYRWVQILGEPIVALAGANTAGPSFKAPALDLGGMPGETTLTFELTVSDGILESTSAVNVRISNVNQAPLADAGLDQAVLENSPVSLNGTGSVDVDGDPLTYAWVQTGGPSVALSGADTSMPTFTAPAVGTIGGALAFRLTVSDSFGGVGEDDVVINVVHVNRPPVANAGTPQIVSEGDVANLIGQASDSDGNPLTLSWSQVSGPAVTLNGVDTLTPSFTAPQVPRGGDTIVLRLSVDDGLGGTAQSDVSVRIANVNHAPKAQAPANLTVAENSLVSLVGQGTDPDAEDQNQLVFAWQQISGPAVTIAGTGANVTFTAPMVGSGGVDAKETLVFCLSVTDPDGLAATDEVQIIVNNLEHAPTAVAGGNVSGNEGATLTLNGSGSTDPDGDPLNYSWEQTAGLAVELLDADTAHPYFVAPFVGTTGAALTFKLTVDDGAGNTSSDLAVVSVVNVNDLPVVVNAKPSIAVLWPPDHRMVKVTIGGVYDPNNNATITITGVTQDEATNGLGDGDTNVDAVIKDDGHSVLLRAERSGKGDGRVYRVHFVATDLEGSVPGVVEVVVPKNKKAERAINSGSSISSTK